VSRARLALPLRTRLAALLAVALVVALAGMIVLTDTVYGRLQRSQLEALLERDLDRVEALVRTGALGQAFVADDAGAVRLQFVSNAGVVQLPEPGEAPLPLASEATAVRIDGVPWLVASEPWALPSGLVIGTIRMALDLRESEASRAVLRVSLVASAVATLLLAGVAGILQVRRALRPLVRLAADTQRLDPAEPSLRTFVGPDDEVAQLARALERALAAIRERQQAERDALAEVAHELAAPLTLVAGELRDLVRRHPDDPRVRAARAAADELLHTSRDLLTLARGELEAPLDLAVVDAREVSRDVAAEYPGVRVDGGSGDARVLADSERLRQVVRNLVRNAVQARGGHEGVAVHVDADADAVRVEVEDDGPGLDAEALARVFERYYSGRPGGAGVGLAVVRRLVAAMGGSVEVRSEPGATRFTVELPSLGRMIGGA
jgi:two-component system, OmpR family, sensor kinase